MRALCGAIISAGALLGLGLATIGVGMRYAGVPIYTGVGDNRKYEWIHFWQMDVPLIVAMVVSIAALIVGLGIAILGLAYHHHRRHLEHLHRIGELPARDRTDVPVS
jgi:hypothetical protein